MPFLSDSRDITVSSSRLIDIGRDQITVNNIFIGPHDLPAALNPPTVFQENVITTHYSKATSSSDIATGLIIEIVQSFMGLHSPNGYRDLKLRLESLQQTVVLTELAVEAYEYTPVGRSLAKAINLEMESCVAVLQKLRKTIDSYSQVPKSSFVGYVLSNSWASGCEPNEIASIREQLRICQSSLCECLKALESYVSISLLICRLLMHHIP
jgi:hypothetical protein